jgi:hypothetical protein
MAIFTSIPLPIPYLARKPTALGRQEFHWLVLPDLKVYKVLQDLQAQPAYRVRLGQPVRQELPDLREFKE